MSRMDSACAAGRALLSLAWLVAAAMAPAVVARAGAPFVTDDPEPVDLHHWEVFLAGQASHDPDGWSGSSPLVDVNYGAASNLQLHLIIPLAFDAPEHGPTHVGYGDTELGAKYRFVQETEDLPQIGVYPLIDLPSGNDAQGLGSGFVRAFLPIWLQKSWGDADRPWTSYGGAGYWINPGSGNRDWWYFGALLQRRVTDWLTLGAEVFHQTAQETDGDGATWVNAGAIVDLDDTYHLLASAGHNIQGQSGFQTYVGIRFNFGSHLSFSKRP